MLAALAPLTGSAAGGGDALAVKGPAGWEQWWRADRAPARWDAPLPAVAGAVRWRGLAPGAEWGELSLSGSGEAWRVRVVLTRIDPASFRLTTQETRRTDGRPGPWSIDSAPAQAVVALNAGQFTSRGPWGWVVRDGVELRPPGSGPLAPALVVDGDGEVRLIPAEEIAAARASGRVREAFQSYPALLAGEGEIPPPLREAGRGVDLDHRDARLALCLLRDGRLLVALTRFEALGGALSTLPFGLTTPETAALMGALGCRRSMLLDGGISSQLRLREPDGTVHRWRGIRRVPLALLALPAGRE
ncbi:MAG TPA: phosphodiester glycosidase family protein [Gemmatimonadales bacterium]|nr:phosphodiester glycosidase family protein [Gemmatimonadales bacterium]